MTGTVFRGLEQAEQVAFGPDARAAAEVWSDPAIPRTIAARPLPDHLVTYLAGGYRHGRFLANQAVPWAQRLRVVEAMSGPTKRSLDVLLHNGALRADQWVTLLPHVPTEAISRAFAKVRAALPLEFARLVTWAWANGDDATRAKLAATLPLTDEDRWTRVRLPVGLAVTDHSPLVRTALARNNHWPGLKHHMSVAAYRAAYALLSDPDPKVRATAWQRGLDTVYGSYRRPEVLAEAATRITAPGSLWPDIFADPDPKVRFTAVDGPLRGLRGQRMSEFYERLLADGTAVRLLIARAAHTPPRVLDRLAADEEVRVRVAVAKHRQVSGETLLRLVRDPDPKVRRAAGERTLAALAIA